MKKTLYLKFILAYIIFGRKAVKQPVQQVRKSIGFLLVPVQQESVFHRKFLMNIFEEALDTRIDGKAGVIEPQDITVIGSIGVVNDRAVECSGRTDQDVPLR